MNTVIITGAARGIGVAAARKFAENGYGVILNALHDSPALKEAAEQCSSLSGIKCHAVCGDISKPDFADALVAACIKNFGHVAVLVNNAGISFVGLIQDTDNDTWQKIINTNLSSVHYTTRSVIPHMLKNHEGRIINISSVWGSAGASCETAYSASKGGINAYTRASAKELAPSGISVNAVACGCVKTDMLDIYSEEELKELAEQIPLGRLATPKEIAEIIFYMAKMPVYLTGQIITADGGWI